MLHYKDIETNDKKYKKDIHSTIKSILFLRRMVDLFRTKPVLPAVLNTTD